MKIQFISLILFLVIASGLYGQSEIFYEAGHKIEVFREQDGVMKQEVAGILEDSKGYIWIANLDYLLKYDGYAFKKYKIPKRQALLGIALNLFRFIKEDDDGYIWVSMFGDGGLVRFNPETEEFVRVRNDEKLKPLSANNTKDIAQDTLGNLWVGSFTGLTRITLDGPRFTTKKFNPPFFSIKSKAFIDSLANIQGKIIKKIQQVGNAEEKKETVELQKLTEILIVNVGEALQSTSDYGWIETEYGEIIWSFDNTRSIGAGGAGKNKIQLDTLILPPGKYYLNYSSDGSHSFGNWNDTPPIVPDWWGIQLFDIEGIDVKRAFQLDRNDNAEIFEDATFTFPFKDKNGTLFTLANGSIYKIHQKENDSIDFILMNKKLKEYIVTHIETGSEGNIWILAESSTIGKKLLFSYLPEQNKLEEIKTTGLPNTSLGEGQLAEDANGNLWIGLFSYGLYKLSPPFYKISDTVHTPNIERFNFMGEKPQVRALEIDSKNSLWVGFRTQSLGKINLDYNEVEFVDIASQTNLKKDWPIRNIFEDSYKNIWFTCFNKGLARYNQVSKEANFYQDDFMGIDARKLIVLLEDSHQNVWMAGDGQLIKHNLLKNSINAYPLPNSDKFESNRAISLVEESDDKIWVLSSNNGLYQFNKSIGQFKPIIEEKLSLDITTSSFEELILQTHHIIKDRNKGIWALVGQGYGPILHLNINGKKIDSLEQFFLQRNILNINQDAKGDIWAGGSSNLTYYDVEKDSLFNFGGEEGLKHDKILSLIEDNNGNIWTYTPLGLSMFNPRNQKFSSIRKLNAQNPLSQSGFNRKLLTKDKNGTIKALMKGGFLSFHPDSIKKNTITPTIQIEQINAAGKSVYSNKLSANSSNEHLDLSYFQNDLSIDFLGINFDDAKSQQYAYQLSDINEEWVHAGTEQTARYPNLPSGDYTFNIKAANADGVWSEPKSLSFTINPPWWKTWWAYLVYSLLIIGVLAYWYRSLQQKIKQKEAQLQKEQSHNKELTDLNTANQRFVPQDFLQILGKQSIKDLHLGDQTHTQMTILFSDIRSYTTLSEKMTPQENFNFINAYLGRVGPIIKAHGGFISQYMGDGFMALFVEDSSNAAQAAIAIQKELQVYNQERVASSKVPLKTGIGLNTGDLMLGVIGDEHRYESTVISDAVNTASRMEGLTKTFGAAIILSEKTLSGLLDKFPLSSKLKEADNLLDNENLSSKTPFAYRSLGKVKVKGKDKALKIYDLYEGESVAIRELKAQTKPAFEQGISHYFNRQFGKSAECFKQVLAVNEADLAAEYYLDKSVGYIVDGVGADWSGVEEMVMK